MNRARTRVFARICARRRLLIKGVAATLLLIASWAPYVLRNAYDYDLIAQTGLHAPAAATIYLALGGIVTLALGFWVVESVAAIYSLASRGLPVRGAVKTISPYGSLFRTRATIAFKIDGAEIRANVSLPKRTLAATPVGIVYDPRDPRRCEVVELLGFGTAV